MHQSLKGADPKPWKIVKVHREANWCRHCQRQHPLLQALLDAASWRVLICLRWVQRNDSFGQPSVDIIRRVELFSVAHVKTTYHDKELQSFQGLFNMTGISISGFTHAIYRDNKSASSVARSARLGTYILGRRSVILLQLDCP